MTHLDLRSSVIRYRTHKKMIAGPISSIVVDKYGTVSLMDPIPSPLLSGSSPHGVGDPAPCKATVIVPRCGEQALSQDTRQKKSVAADYVCIEVFT